MSKMTDTTDIKALRRLSLQRVKEIANGDSTVMGEKVDLANTALHFHKELGEMADAFKHAALLLFSVQDQLEAERQRADDLQHADYLTWHAASCKTHAENQRLKAEIAALRGAQEPVVLTDDTVLDWGYRNDIKGDASKLRCMIDDAASLSNYQISRQPKPVVVLPSITEERFQRYDEMHDITVFDEDVYVPEVIAILEAAGIVVKEGE